MQVKRSKGWTPWLAIVLVLLNLLAPTVSHAVGSAKGSLHASLEAATLCASYAGSGSASAPSPVDHGDGGDGLAASLDACGYCASVLLSGALPPLATSFHVRSLRANPWLASTQLRPRTVEPLRRHRARAPPLIA